MRAWKWSGIAILAATCYALSGCGGGTASPSTPVTGTLLVDGTPAAGDDDETELGYEVKFYPLDDSGALVEGGGNYSAMVGNGGKFTLRGHTVTEPIPAGKYRVAVFNWTAQAGGNEEAGGDKTDAFKDKYGKDKSDITLDVAPGADIKVEVKTGE